VKGPAARGKTLCKVFYLPETLLWFGAGWLRRRKLAELHEVKNILDEMDGKNAQ
jgi:hypothetical protein